MDRPITVGVNSSPESLAAADWAAREAQLRGRPLRLLYAWDWLPVHGSATPNVADTAPHWPERMLKEAVTDLESRYPRLPITADQVEDKPVTALLDAAREAELLVLGSRGLGAVAGFLAGSVSLGVLAAADHPVVLVRAGGLHDGERRPESAIASTSDARHGEVVLAPDLEHPCDPVIEFAFHTAAVHAAPLRVIHTWKLHPAVAFAPTADEAAVEKGEGLALSAALLPWREKYPDVVVSEQVVKGSAARQLVQVAPGAGLLVVGRWKHRPAAGTRIGPVTHAVIHHAAVPVAVVPHS